MIKVRRAVSVLEYRVEDENFSQNSNPGKMV